MKWLTVGLWLWVSACSAQAGFLGFADVEFIPYEGSQAHWRTAPGASVDRSFKLPVFYGLPPRPYIVIGTVQVSGAGGFTQEASAIRDAVSAARKRGATAVIMMGRGKDDAGLVFTHFGNGNFNARTRREGRAEVIAIKWRK